MRCMIIVKATRDSEAGVLPPAGRTVSDGPFTETREPIAGYTLDRFREMGMPGAEKLT